MESDQDQTELGHVGMGEEREGTRWYNKEAKDAKGQEIKMSKFYREVPQEEGRGWGIPTTP